jgi:hypothetical protein
LHYAILFPHRQAAVAVTAARVDNKYMNFSDHKQFGGFLSNLGVTRAFFKPLSENDNSKNQIYLGNSFGILQQIPFGEITEHPDNKNPNYKAGINLWWINDSGNVSHAPHAQLILYTRYPEVRLSGFLKNCPTAPGKYMKPPKKEERQKNNAKDGRILVLGICFDNKIYCYLAPKDSALAVSIIRELFNETSGKTIQDFSLEQLPSYNKIALINKLEDIIKTGWHESVKLDKDGIMKKYNARNGGGYTLEALFGIIPNGKAEPDYKGWELKAFSGTRITLMTPEPDKGFYREHGAKAFTLKYGHDAPRVIKYFTGTHKAGIRNKTSNMKLVIKGFDYRRNTISNMDGGLFLVDQEENIAAIWSFKEIIKHWSRKHARACYVNYELAEKDNKIGYIYHSPVYLGENTDISLFLKALQSGFIVYDPATKVTLKPDGKTESKARSQFRVNFRDLVNLYEHFYAVDFTATSSWPGRR